MEPFFQKVEGAPPPERVPDFEGDPSRDTASMLFHRWFDGWFMSNHFPLTEYYECLLPLFPKANEVILLGDHEHRDGEIPEWAERPIRTLVARLHRGSSG